MLSNQLLSNPVFGPTVLIMADGEGGNGNTDGQLIAAAVAERETEVLIQLEIAKQVAESGEG